MYNEGMHKSIVIFESPDGGETVYARAAGSTQRKLHSIGGKQVKSHDVLSRAQLWRNIHCAAETDAVLQDMLDRIEVYYHLKNSP